MIMKKHLSPYLLSGPALLIFIVMLVVPMLMTLILSFNSFDFYGGIKQDFGWHNYLEVIQDSYFHIIFLRTYGIAIAVTFICALIGAPEAYILNRMSKNWRSLCLLAILGPLLISVIVRTLGWALLIGNNGVINEILLGIGIIDTPVKMMFTTTSIVVALVHVLVPFMVLSVWTTLQKLDPQVESAALSLGASHFTTLRRVILPQVMPGVLAGSLIVFALTASAFATPSILGGRRLKVVATTAYDEYLNTLNWPLGAAIAVILLIANVVVVMSYNRYVERKYASVFD
jgi:putative spermidine/putrescine transport system permease protein